jgi:glycosyltransferase involved in cell wall biosynthesis
MKVGIYDPYLDTLGGGERYCLTVAETLLKSNHHVDLFWSGDPSLIKRAESRFSLDLKGLNIVPDVFHLGTRNLTILSENPAALKDHAASTPKIHSPLYSFRQFLNKLTITRSYDLIFYLSDGSLPFLFSKKNILHIQVPFQQNRPSLIQSVLIPLKLIFISHVVCNSQFTRRFTSNYLNSKALVLYPPVDVANFSSNTPKEKIILSVGRFDNLLNAKKQDILLECFKSLSKKYPDWRLILAGGSQKSITENVYLNTLKNQAKKYPVEFYVNPEFSQLQQLYSRSSLYWHAAGYNVDENNSPENTEHFGIAVVEAMSSACVPLVVAKGGLPEIVQDSQNGFLWNRPSDLLEKTEKLIKDPKLMATLSINALNSSSQYSKETFNRQIIKLITGS